MGYGNLGANNPKSKIPTPNLDQLTAGGMRFTDGHSSSGICTPSRFALLTGKHHWRSFYSISGPFTQSKFKPADYTMGELFQAQGYHAAAIGKWHLGWDWKSITLKDVPTRSAKTGRGKERTFLGPEAFDWSKPFKDGPLDHGFDYYFGDGTIIFLLMAILKMTACRGLRR